MPGAYINTVQRCPDSSLSSAGYPPHDRKVGERTTAALNAADYSRTFTSAIRAPEGKTDEEAVDTGFKSPQDMMTMPKKNKRKGNI